jgi:hypothetical protein
MNLTTLRALTWGTVAAAVLSALLLAVVESGGGDVSFGLGDADEVTGRASPSDTSAAPGARLGMPSPSSRAERHGSDATGH